MNRNERSTAKVNLGALGVIGRVCGISYQCTIWLAKSFDNLSERLPNKANKKKSKKRVNFFTHKVTYLTLSWSDTINSEATIHLAQKEKKQKYF